MAINEGIPVRVYDKETDEILREYPSIAKAARDGKFPVKSALQKGGTYSEKFERMVYVQEVPVSQRGKKVGHIEPKLNGHQKRIDGKLQQLRKNVPHG